MKFPINIWAVLVSGAAATGLGLLWFMVIFREPYIKDLDKTKEQLDRGPDGLPSILMQLGGNFVMAAVIAYLLYRTNQSGAVPGIVLGVICWVGFVAAVTGPMYAFMAFSFRFFLITTGYTLACAIIMGAITGAWK